LSGKSLQLPTKNDKLAFHYEIFAFHDARYLPEHMETIMTKTFPKTTGQWVLWLTPLFIVPIAFFASLPWLKQQDDATALGVAAMASLFMMGYSYYLAARANRGLDEVEIAGQRFASAKGMIIGTVVAVLVIMFPPLLNALAGLANTLSTDSPDIAVKLGIAFGSMLVLFSQLLGTTASAVWWRHRLRGSV
jgi:hypothetical protein